MTQFIAKTLRNIFALSLACALLLSGCNLPLHPMEQATPTTDIVATQVAELLTAQPSQTAPTQAPSPNPSPTSEATLAPTPTEQAAPTPTTNPSDPALALGEPSWQDSLDSAKNFYLYENDNTRIEAEDGVLSLTGLQANGWLGWTLTYAQEPADFYLETTFRTHECSGSDQYGVLFRASKESKGYFFAVTCDGRYNLYARDFENDINAELIPFTAGAGLLSGSNQTNRLGVMAQGNKLTFYANGVLLGELSDPTYSQGYFGAFVAAGQTAGFRVDLDQIKLWKY
jgi:hypothetical protein